MRKLYRSKHFYIDASLFALFWISTRFMETGTTLLLTNSLLLAASVAVAVAYVPVAWAAIRGELDPKTQHLTLGISYHWSGQAIWRIISLIWLLGGMDRRFVTNDFVAFLQFVISVGAIYHLTSPGALGTNKPSVKGIAVAGVCGVAAFCAAGLSIYQPNTKWIVDALLPYMPGS